MTITERTWTERDARLLPCEVCIPCGKLLVIGEKIVEAFDSNTSRIVHSACFKSRQEASVV